MLIHYQIHRHNQKLHSSDLTKTAPGECRV